MSRISNIAGGRRFRGALRELLKPTNWLFEFRQEQQRKRRGWSDRDTWNGGDYILEVTAGVLKKLGDEKSHIDWDDYFKTNYPNNQGYTSLYEVAKDIDDYLDFDRLGWGDKLSFKIKHDISDDGLLTSGNTPEEQREIKKTMEAHIKEGNRKYKKAKKAMTFVAVNFPALWD